MRPVNGDCGPALMLNAGDNVCATAGGKCTLRAVIAVKAVAIVGRLR